MEEERHIEKEKRDVKEDRPFTEKTEPKKSKTSYGTIITIIVILIIIGAVTGMYYYVKSNAENPKQDAINPNLREINENHYIYNNYDFVFSKGFWVTKVFRPETNKEVVVRLHHGPRDLQEIPTHFNVRDFLIYAKQFAAWDNSSGALYVLFDPKENATFGAAYIELSANLKEGIGFTVYPAFTYEDESKPYILVKDCNSTNEPIIELVPESPARISYDGGNCIKVYGENADILKSSNLLIHQFYGIVGG